MINAQPQLQTLHTIKSLSFLLPKPSFSRQCGGAAYGPPCPRGRRNRNDSFRVRASSGFKEKSGISLGTTRAAEKIKVRGIITVKDAKGSLFGVLSITRPLDEITDLRGRSLLVELVSSEPDPDTGLEKEMVKDYAHRIRQEGEEEKLECVFNFPKDFGPVGAVLVQNEHHKEMYLKDIVIELPTGRVTFTCNSWVHSKFDNPSKRIFFSNKSYLPSKTPKGLEKLRRQELENLRGINRLEEGEFKPYERIYDYDKYNDLGEPDKSKNLKRPVLGGEEHPYPRRCKTGRPHCKTDMFAETREGTFYVPRDEEFSEEKGATFTANTIGSAIPALIPMLECILVDPNKQFPHFKAIESLFHEGINLPKNDGLLKSIPRLVTAIADSSVDLLQFETPDLYGKDRFSWMRDEEFARQTLAGINPYSIELVREWPLTSKLDPKIYGPPESLITKELIKKEIGGIMTFEEAFEQKRLFMLDYHDLYLPYVNKVRDLGRSTLYGSRTLFFLNDDSTLRPIAIELTRPPRGDRPQWKQVFTRGYNSTDAWLWKLAKAHVLAHDSGYHQLVVHWLRTHCCMEPYIIAANRCLSAMHPVYRLLHPHFRYTMEINARARQSLINADGIIENSFSPAEYSIELSSVAYDKLWRFDMEALPADLIRRGMAVEDSNAKHGLRLTIEDYPFANDGLILWDAIKQWATDYVNHYYTDAAMVENDHELQEWWLEVRTKGHGDKEDEPWWPVLKTQEDLINILSTIMWVASGHHAAVNFGQYPYGGYFPNRPTSARINMPTEDPKEEEFEAFLEDPELVLMKTFPSQRQATSVVVTLNILSSHSPDEEYIGEKPEPSWAEDPVIMAAYEQFKARLYYLEGVIDARNADIKLKNRKGAGVVKYELLKPFSESGVTGKGVPNSISI